MYKNFKDSFLYFLGGRTCEELYDLYKDDEQYKYYGELQSHYYKEMKKHVSKEKEKLFFHDFCEYESAENMMESISLDIIYAQGIRDGIELIKILKPDLNP